MKDIDTRKGNAVCDDVTTTPSRPSIPTNAPGTTTTPSSTRTTTTISSHSDSNDVVWIQQLLSSSSALLRCPLLMQHVQQERAGEEEGPSRILLHQEASDHYTTMTPHMMMQDMNSTNSNNYLSCSSCRLAICHNEENEYDDDAGACSPTMSTTSYGTNNRRTASLLRAIDMALWIVDAGDDDDELFGEVAAAPQ